MASFSVVALMKEDGVVVRRFLEYYLALGAERVFILHDGPIDHLVADGLEPTALAARGVALHACDAAFWLSHDGAVPANIQHRLRSAFALGHRWNESDWLLVCDADEFVIDRIPLAEFLDRIPADIDSVRLRPAEAVWGPDEDIDAPFGSTWFRYPTRASAKRAVLSALWIYGPFGLLLRKGLLGHFEGKQFVRRGAEFELIHQHHAVRGGRVVSRFAGRIDPALAAVELAHFDAISYGRWREKCRRRVLHDDRAAMSERPLRRRAQLGLFRQLSRLGDGATRWMFRRLYGLSGRQLRLLRQSGQAFQARLFRPDGQPATRAEEPA